MGVLFLSGLLSVPFAGISSTTQLAFEQSYQSVCLTYSLYLLAGIILAIPGNKIINELGVKRTIIICVGLMSIGSTLRIMINAGFYWVYAGQVIAGSGSLLVQNCIFYFCYHTFSNKRVD